MNDSILTEAKALVYHDHAMKGELNAEGQRELAASHAALLARVRELEAEWRPVSERPPNGIYEVYANDGCDSLRRFAEYTNYRGWDVAYIKFWRVPAPLPPFPNTGETA